MLFLQKSYRKFEKEKKNTPAKEDEKIHWLNTEDYTMNCVKINEKDETCWKLQYVMTNSQLETT